MVQIKTLPSLKGRPHLIKRKTIYKKKKKWITKKKTGWPDSVLNLKSIDFGHCNVLWEI